MSLTSNASRRPIVRLLASVLAVALALVGLAAPAANAASGAQYGWGFNTNGNVGDGSASAAVTSASAVTMPSGVSYFKQVVTSSAGSCAIGSNDVTYCWGENDEGFVGDGTQDNKSVPTAVTMPSGVTKFVTLFATYNQACGLTADGTAYCWGENYYGQLGDGTATRKLVPTAVDTSAKFKSLTMSSYTTCGISTTDATYCWGDAGTTGNGQNTVDVLSPELVVGSHTFESVVDGDGHYCGLTPAGAAWCWGFGFFGTNGNGSTANQFSPVQVVGGHTFSALFGGNKTFCGLEAGAAWCWGWGNVGQMGNGTTTMSNPTPVAVSGGHTFESIVTGQSQNLCGLTTAGEAYCWGANAQGQAGDGGATGVRNEPVATAGGHTFKRLIPARSSFCGITTSDVLYCWGNGADGAIGNGTTTATNSTPTAVNLPTGVTSFADVTGGFWAKTMQAAALAPEPPVNNRPGKPRNPKTTGAPTGSTFLVSWKKSLRATSATRYRVDVRQAGKPRILIRKATKGLKVKFTRQQLLAATPRARGDVRAALLYRVTIVAITGSLVSAPARTTIRLVR